MRTRIMYIIVVLCALSFMAGFGIEKAWGFSGNRDNAALLVILAAGADHHKDMGIVDVIAPEEGCPIEQMRANPDLEAFLIYYAPPLDFNDTDWGATLNKLLAIEKHFTDKDISPDRVTVGVSNVFEWHEDINLNKGKGIYIILK